MAKVLSLANHLAYAPGRSAWLRSNTLLKHLLKSHQAFLGSFAETAEDDGTCNPLDICLHLQHLAGFRDGIGKAIAILLATPDRAYKKSQPLSHIDAYLSLPAMAGTT